MLLDNLYCSGEVSQDGQPWTTSAYANEFTQRAWTLSYSKHGSVDTGDGIAEQSTPYIWELARTHGLKVETFGMGNRRGVAEVRSVRFEQRASDPQAEQRTAEDESQRGRDYVRADRFVAEFQDMDRAGTVPNFMFMSLGENHTSGTTPGAYTPKAQVASNDVAVGKIVEAITKSKVWNEFAIFIIEDDAQNGPDHVDSHRTAGLVISPYVKTEGRRQHDVLHGQHAAHRRVAARAAADDPARRRRAADGQQFHGEARSLGLHGAPCQNRSDGEEPATRLRRRRIRAHGLQ